MSISAKKREQIDARAQNDADEDDEGAETVGAKAQGVSTPQTKTDSASIGKANKIFSVGFVPSYDLIKNLKEMDNVSIADGEI